MEPPASEAIQVDPEGFRCTLRPRRRSAPHAAEWQFAAVAIGMLWMLPIVWALALSVSVDAAKIVLLPSMFSILAMGLGMPLIPAIFHARSIWELHATASRLELVTRYPGLPERRQVIDLERLRAVPTATGVRLELRDGTVALDTGPLADEEAGSWVSEAIESLRQQNASFWKAELARAKARDRDELAALVGKAGS